MLIASLMRPNHLCDICTYTKQALYTSTTEKSQITLFLHRLTLKSLPTRNQLLLLRRGESSSDQLYLYVLHTWTACFSSSISSSPSRFVLHWWSRSWFNNNNNIIGTSLHRSTFQLLCSLPSTFNTFTRRGNLRGSIPRNPCRQWFTVLLGWRCSRSRISSISRARRSVITWPDEVELDVISIHDKSFSLVHD